MTNNPISCHGRTPRAPGLSAAVLALAGLMLVLGFAGAAEAASASGWLAGKRVRANASAITYCSHHGCQKRTLLSLKGKLWNRIAATVRRGRGSPASERRQIAAAMKYLELAGGKASGSAHDKPRTQFDSRGQLDCVDEATNMTALLVALDRAKLLRHHTPLGPTRRGVTDGRPWLHYAGTVQEKRSKKVYVIDSWFRPNGNPAVVVPRAKWLTGWSPKK